MLFSGKIRDNMRGLFINIVLGLMMCITVQAQQLDREYQLNQETLDAIRNGTLLHNDRAAMQPLLSPSDLPVSREFGEIRDPEHMFRDLSILQLPFSGILLYRYEPDSILIVRSAYLKDVDDVLVREYFRIPHSSIEITAPGADLDVPDIEFVNGEWQGNLHPRTFAIFSAENGLEDLFEPTERHKRENRRNANAWKTYNMEDMDE